MSAAVKVVRHIAYAETSQITAGNINKAGAEIDKAKGYLNSAAKNADSKVKAKINAMEKEIDKIKNTQLPGIKPF